MKEPILNMVMYVRRGDSPNALMNFMRIAGMQRNIQPENCLITMLCSGTKDIVEEITKHFQWISTEWISTDVIDVGSMTLAEAYNQQIVKTQAPWVLFMDCGDFFPDVYSLSMILNLLPTDEYDILWMARYDELVPKSGETWTNVVDDIDRRIYGKLFRTRYLLENGIFFDEKVTHDVGDVFLMTAMSRTDYTRFVKINTRFVPYAHVRQKPKEAPGTDEIVLQHHETNMDVIRNVGQKNQEDFYMQCVMRAVCEAYYYMHMGMAQDAMRTIEEEIRKVCGDNWDMIRKVKARDIEVFLDEAQEKALSICNKAYIEYGYEMYFDVDDEPFTRWLIRVADLHKNQWPRLSGDRKKARVRQEKDKVAVFCGTRNVYDSMETAAKSLMCHTKMDRVYFLIEDDTFPRELPENVKCINVSGQKWFDPKGKNYRNSWTWMCMMRAAFAKLLPVEHQVLSLDIDVVVNDDISELWDIDLKDYYFAGVPETMQTEKKKTTYCNFGVIMLNLDRIRKTRIDDTIIESLNKDKWGCPEQDAFNHFCAGEIYALDSKYNATRTGHITADTEEEKISHYAGIKYWKQFKPFKKFAGMSWEEVMK